MVKIRLVGINDNTTVNAMIHSGATADFIDQEFCNKYLIPTTKAKSPRDIYLADGQPSSMGPVTHIPIVPMDIGADREITTFQVAKLQNHEAILGMPWLRNHNPVIHWRQGKITFNSDQCTTMCINESPTVYTIPEAIALEQNLVCRFSTIQSKKDKRILVKKIHKDAKIPTKGTKGAPGHGLYGIEDKTFQGKGQQVVQPGISLRLPNGTYGRIAPRRGLAVKHSLTVNTVCNRQRLHWRNRSRPSQHLQL